MFIVFFSFGCHEFVFPCENCFDLVSDSSRSITEVDTIIHCQYCGFGNLLDNCIRKNIGKQYSNIPIPYPIVVSFIYIIDIIVFDI